MSTELLTREIRERMLRNGRGWRPSYAARPSRISCRSSSCSRPMLVAPGLPIELEPDQPDIAFGLCDLGTGYPELGSVSLTELASYRIWNRIVGTGQQVDTTLFT